MKKKNIDAFNVRREGFQAGAIHGPYLFFSTLPRACRDASGIVHLLVPTTEDNRPWQRQTSCVRPVWSSIEPLSVVGADVPITCLVCLGAARV